MELFIAYAVAAVSLLTAVVAVVRNFSRTEAKVEHAAPALLELRAEVKALDARTAQLESRLAVHDSTSARHEKDFDELKEIMAELRDKMTAVLVAVGHRSKGPASS